MQEEQGTKQITYQFSVGIGSLEEENSILSTGLKETLKSNREKFETKVREINRAFRFLKFVQGFINDEDVLPLQNEQVILSN